MTLSILSAKKAGKNPSFFLRELLQTRTQFLLWTVAMFMALPVVSLSQITGYSYERIISGTEKLRDIAAPMYASMWVMLAAGIIAGVAAFSVFHNKKSAYFYLSLPVTRTELFITRTVTGAIPAIAAYLINVLVSVFIFASNPHFGFFEIIPAFVKLGAQTILMYFWVYAFTVFAASLTSRGGANILLTVWTFLILPAYQLCIWVMFNLTAPNAYLPWLESEALVTYTVPLVRMVMLQDGIGDIYPRPYPDTVKVTDIDFYASVPWYEAVIIIAVSALLIVAAAFILKKRPAENSGESAVFRKVGEIIKLTALIPAGILFALFFNELFGIVGLFFGIVWGVFVVFLILNLFLYRSGKKLFTGIKAASVLTVALILFVIAFLFVGSNIENRKYTPDNTASITVRVQPFGELKLDPEKCGELLEYIDKKNNSSELGSASIFTKIAVPEEEYTISSYNMIYNYYKSYKFTLKPKFGIGIERYYSFDAESENILYEAIRASSKDGIDLLAGLFPADDNGYLYYESYLDIDYDFAPIYKNIYTENDKLITRDIAAKIAERRSKEFLNGYSDGFAIGYVQYYTANDGYVSLPVYLTDGDILGKEFCTPEYLLEHIEQVTVSSELLYKYSDGRVTEALEPELSVYTVKTDKEKLSECFYSSVGSDRGYGGVFDKARTDISFRFDGSYNGLPFTFYTYPRTDKVPQFVQDLIDARLAKYELN